MSEKTMKKDLGWCSVELSKGRVHVCERNLSPEEAKQLAAALVEVAESYVDSVYAKAEELRSEFYNAPKKGLPPGEHDRERWMRLARHVLGTPPVDPEEGVEEAKDRSWRGKNSGCAALAPDLRHVYCHRNEGHTGQHVSTDWTRSPAAVVAKWPNDKVKP